MAGMRAVHKKNGTTFKYGRMATSLCDMGKREECEIKVHETEFRQIHGRDGKTGVHE